MTCPDCLALKSDVRVSEGSWDSMHQTFQEQLGHRDESKDIRGEHGFYVRFFDVSCLLPTQNEASIVHW